MAALVRYLEFGEDAPTNAKYFIHSSSEGDDAFYLTEYAPCYDIEDIFIFDEVRIYFNSVWNADSNILIERFEKWVNNIADFLDSTILYVEKPSFFYPYSEDIDLLWDDDSFYYEEYEKEIEYQTARAARYPEYTDTDVLF